MVSYVYKEVDMVGEKRLSRIDYEDIISGASHLSSEFYIPDGWMPADASTHHLQREPVVDTPKILTEERREIDEIRQAWNLD